MPREYVINALVIVPVILIAAGTAAFLFLGHTQRQLAEITSEVAAITDGRSLHRRLALSEESSDFSDLVTTLNAMIARLETSFGALRRFTADASHELKTPLAVLRADVERAMMTPSQTERMVALEESLQEVRRMTDLVESLLTLARADEGRFDIHREPIELQPLVQEVYETALILGEAQGVAVNLPFTADVVVMADRTRLRQLFLNLVTNAIKYTPAGGKVELGVGRHPDNVTFAVRDTGIGIAAADVPHIFERFWRADRVRSRMSERGGFGLGLAISQWIAQAHGGTLTASSRLGRGSLFTVTLPLPPDLQRS
jgi:signal transduction histidine kinase